MLRKTELGEELLLVVFEVGQPHRKGVCRFWNSQGRFPLGVEYTLGPEGSRSNNSRCPSGDSLGRNWTLRLASVNR